jgi:hypothetical protein
MSTRSDNLAHSDRVRRRSRNWRPLNRADTHTRPLGYCMDSHGSGTDTCILAPTDPSSSVCQCNWSNTESCDPINGQCVCKNGFTGDGCTKQCSKGQWGPGCKYQCRCRGYPCNSLTGECECPPGSMGANCDSACGRDHYGPNCRYVCSCKNGGECDRITGQCRCKQHYAGPLCETYLT